MIPNRHIEINRPVDKRNPPENSGLRQGGALTQMYAMALAVVIVAAGAVYWNVYKTANDTSVVTGTSFPDIYTSPLLIKLADLDISILPLGARPARASVEGNVVKYIDAYLSTDVVQTKSFNKIKEDIILKQRGHPGAFQYRIDLKSYDFAKDGKGNFIFYQKGHKGDNDFWRFAIPAPFMIDASGKKSSTTDVESDLDGEGLLTIKPSAGWLAGAVYPVVLDPTVEINVVNVHSRPQLGDNWTVDFATRGTADLKIIPNDQATIDDDEFVSLSCNGETRTPQILPGDIIFYPNWSCSPAEAGAKEGSGTSRVVHFTKKAGNHTLRFEFGGQVSYAYNSSAVSPIIFRAGIPPPADTATYVEDVFSAYTYTGNSSTQTITNGIDLAGKGGLVWIKERTNPDFNGPYSNYLIDTTRGVSNSLSSNQTTADTAYNHLTAFNSDGFTIANAGAQVNGSPNTYVSWTFRNSDRFYGHSVVVKSASADATASFAGLGTLGMVRVKRTDAAGSWYIWHRSLTAGKLLIGETTATEATLGHITVSGTTVTLEDGVIADGTYLVEAWAHDTAADGIIQCGSYTSDGAGNFPATHSLGWEPQFFIHKRMNVAVRDWYVLDTSRGWTTDGTGQKVLYANLTNTEASGTHLSPAATGLANFPAGNANETYIYCAIRRPNKPPTSGAQVFTSVAGNAGSPSFISTHNVDMMIDLYLLGGQTDWHNITSRLTGGNLLATLSTAAESSAWAAYYKWDYPTGAAYNLNNSHVGLLFRRAPGVFDAVAYTGTGVGVGLSPSHNLAAVPQLMIIKERSPNAGQWRVYDSFNGNDNYMALNTTAATASGYGAYWNSTTPTASIFSVSSSNNILSSTYVAYLFATKAGISKVGSYTGNGSSQTIGAGFSGGARFVLIKRTDSTGDWYVWDSTRGIVAGNDPHLSLNTSAAEVTTDDSIDPENGGFIVNQNATTNINVSSATYIYLAFSGDTPYTPRTPTVATIFRTGANSPVVFRVPAVAPANTSAPVVTGTATVGQTLACSTGTWTGRPSPTYTYQWQHTTTNISGATNSTYVIESAYIGETIRCVVTATNSAGNASANSNNSGSVTTTVPGAPTIGTATQTGATTATVSFTAPASDGGATITTYTAYPSSGAGSGTLSQAGSGTINVTGLTAGTSYTFTVKATNSVGQSAASSASNSITTAAAPGQQAYTTAQSTSWTAPAGVTSVSVICIGGGGGGVTDDSNANGGGGGGLRYINNYSVTAGNSYSVVVGAGGTTALTTASSGGTSSFNSTTVVANGGGGATNSAVGTGGGGTGSGGNGGNGGTNGGDASISGGGGGAGGYSGNGGNGGSGAAVGTAGAGGGAGGAGGGNNGASGGGGGVGILGTGSNGAGGEVGGNGDYPNQKGGGGSGGTDGTGGNIAGPNYGMGGTYGGGGGGDDVASTRGNASGGVGACRIIWPGDARQFPSTRTADE